MSTPRRTRPPSSPPGPAGRSPRGGTPDLLATEALALARQGCSTRIGVRALQQMADREPALLEAAARRCNRAGDLDHRVRGIALRLLERAASGLRPDPGEPRRPPVPT